MSQQLRVPSEDTRTAPATRIAGPAAALVLTADGVDNGIRWRPGERLHHLFERRCDEFKTKGDPDHLAVDDGELRMTYAQLDAQANQLARHLLAQGVSPGDRVGLFVDKSAFAYLVMLAASKIHAAYVPLDAAFPADRISFIVADAGVRTILTISALASRLDRVDATVIRVDTVVRVDERVDIDLPEARRIGPDELAPANDDLAYIIYTSGTTGQPKGVAINQVNICNFVQVAAETYGLRADDRVYQGMTIAFDFSVEEIWVPLVCGATLVPSTSSGPLVGRDLAAFLARHRVTALCCVPTLLATIEEDVPELRFILVSGEACPPHLVSRWHRPGRTLLNVYGPTETSVTATYARLAPDQPLTIGVPLPTYSVVILDDDQRALPRGETGEIGIAGICLSPGYVNRDDLTTRTFVPDNVGILNNPSRRIYRTGDLGRVNHDGNIEYLGRIDSQVKIRGYRIELTEIESVLLRLPRVAQAAVTSYEPNPGLVELAAFYTRRAGAPPLDHGHALMELRAKLPSYMVPAYLEELPDLPRLPSDKVDRKRLPAPSRPRLQPTRSAVVAPAGAAEAALADLLAELLRVRQVSVEDDFFADLGADSLIMARYCTRVRERFRTDVSIKDMYLNPSVRALAVVVTGVLDADAPAAPVEPPPLPLRVPSGLRYYGCAAAQALFGLAFMLLISIVMVTGYGWISTGAGLYDRALRSLTFGVLVFLAATLLPVAMKWLLIGKWRARTFPIWGLTYLRFWIVKRVVRTSPLVLFRGSPLYSLYLRTLGAKVGPCVVVLSRSVPVCTDLITLGAGTVIRKDVHFLGYRAEAGWITTGPITLGQNVQIGDGSVLEIDTVMGDNAQLCHASSLQAGKVVPVGATFHGSPAIPSRTGNFLAPWKACSRSRRAYYSIGQLLGRVLVDTQTIVVLVVLATAIDISTVAGSLLMFFGAIPVGLLLAVVVPRLANLFLVADRAYPLYGWHWTCFQIVTRFSNVRIFNILFGDSSYILGYLRAIGWRFNRVRQTGSNFGVEQKHDSPFLCDISGGVLVSDGLSMVNARFGSSSFALSRVTIGSESFLGNDIVFPAGARVGENCLLATKVMIPIDGPVREGVGLLGSPPFEIPRSVRRDARFDEFKTGKEFRRRLSRKNRSNLATMGLFLLSRWLLFYLPVLIVVRVEGLLDPAWSNPFVLAAGLALALAQTVVHVVLLNWIVLGFRRLRPLYCSIYDRRFWRHERYWKLGDAQFLALFNGTPFKPLILRLLGVRIGRRVYDDGCGIPERTLVEIGDYCTLNEGSTLQSHSLEDGTFKSDRIRLGNGCTVGTGTLVHYAVDLADAVDVTPGSFVMKGSSAPAGTTWRGNPARQVRTAPDRVRPGPTGPEYGLARTVNAAAQAPTSGWLPAVPVPGAAPDPTAAAPPPNARDAAAGTQGGSALPRRASGSASPRPEPSDISAWATPVDPPAAYFTPANDIEERLLAATGEGGTDALATSVAEVAFGDRVESRPTERTPVEETTPWSRYAHVGEDLGRPTMMQKTIAPDQVDDYLERGYDRVCGFVHRANEVAHLTTPAKLHTALGLGYAGSPFQRDAETAYVLRWPAHRPSLYRIPYGGQNDVAMWAMEGWVIERAPFRGNGFAPGDSNDVIAEFKVDSARLPHGSQLWRISSNGTEALIAILDSDIPIWRKVAAAGEGSTVLRATVLLPVLPASPARGRSGDEGLAWRTETLDAETYVAVFTSRQRHENRTAEPMETIDVKFARLIRDWPNESLSLAVHSGTATGEGGTDALATSVAEVAFGDRVESRPTERTPVEETTPWSRYAHVGEDLGRPTMMQKTIAPDQVDDYLERGYDRVCGFVHRANEVAHLTTPAKLHTALGLGYAGSPFQRDAETAYVLRWPAHRPSLYRIPYGGQNDVAMWAMEGWVIERAPFRGNGFAPGDSNDVIAEFKVDSARLPHGSQLWRISSDGTETLIAVLDSDIPIWRKVEVRG
ncbi:Pls/PosA family non-ribosomal peptide synthetase [Phytohabitans kaempferiae]|uniref:Pls/PosA family non-ribosomal peptide synthetase n=1 Tax=Phytohabitans kaempferiae TaxID=1620943 RepID=UPI00406BDC1E